MQRSALCRSRRELSNEYLLAKFGFDTAENEPCKVCPLSAYGSPRSERELEPDTPLCTLEVGREDYTRILTSRLEMREKKKFQYVSVFPFFHNVKKKNGVSASRATRPGRRRMRTPSARVSADGFACSMLSKDTSE